VQCFDAIVVKRLYVRSGSAKLAMSDSDEVKDAAASDPRKDRQNLTALLFVLFVPLVLLAAFGLNMRKNGVFACPPSYADNNYLAYCGGSAYADFDHGALWYGLEPKALENAKTANVLFVGNSRLQFGFSADSVRTWFAEKGLRPYLLGFSHDENVTFARPLLEKIKPGAGAYVINVDGFFTDQPTLPGNDVMTHESTRARYEGKQSWQYFHERLCSRVGKLCGQTESYYRSRDTGMWRRGYEYANVTPPKHWRQRPLKAEEVARAKDIGPAFIEKLGVPAQCVILTYVPTPENDIISARAIAEALGLELVSPVVPALETYDGSHLDPPSAERFSQAFLEQAGPRLEACAGKQAL